MIDEVPLPEFEPCRRHRWVPTWPDTMRCKRCGRTRDEVKASLGKQARNYGNRAELAVARRYGGEKVGHFGGPIDVIGTEWATQVKTFRRKPPAVWTKTFADLDAIRAKTDGELMKLPRLLLRFLPGPGLPPIDYFVIPGPVWLDWFGRDAESDA